VSESTDPIIATMVRVTGGRASAGGLNGTVELTLGAREPVVVEFCDGRVTGAAAGTGAAKLGLTQAQLEAWLGGALNLTEAYMKGDLKPEGSTGALLAAFEVLDDPAVVAGLAELGSSS
jgi:hypothetical protein